MRVDASHLADHLRSISDRLRDVADYGSTKRAAQDDLVVIAEKIEGLAERCDKLAAAVRLRRGTE